MLLGEHTVAGDADVHGANSWLALLMATLGAQRVCFLFPPGASPRAGVDEGDPFCLREGVALPPRSVCQHGSIHCFFRKNTSGGVNEECPMLVRVAHFACYVFVVLFFAPAFFAVACLGAVDCASLAAVGGGCCWLPRRGADQPRALL